MSVAADPAPPRITLGGVKVDVLSRAGWTERVVAFCRLRPAERPGVIIAANGQVIATCAMEPSYRNLVGQADGVTADGQPLVWASRLTRFPLPERAATTDLFHDVARAAEREGLSFFLFGATERSSAVAEARIRAMYPRLRIVGRRHGYFEPQEEAGIVREINALKPDVLWVGLGIRRQESFAIRNRGGLRDVGCILTCGGLFDYFTDEVRRAPPWMQRFGLEWMFRTWQSPRQYLLRYLTTNPLAALLLLAATRSR